MPFRCPRLTRKLHWTTFPPIDSINSQAARAVHDALPLLTRAKRVDVATVVSEESEESKGTLLQISDYLALHNVDAHTHTIEGDETDVGIQLIDRAIVLGADLVVMGGYGHSRLREFVLGGATRDMLRETTVPVLLSH